MIFFFDVVSSYDQGTQKSYLFVGCILQSIHRSFDGRTLDLMDKYIHGEDCIECYMLKVSC